MDQLFRSILRGFGWTLGRRAAYSASPSMVWMLIAFIVVCWLVGVRF